MARAVTIERSLGAAAAAALLALALVAAPRAGAGQSEPSRASRVDVVGSGTLARRQVVVRARPSEKAPRVAVLKEFRPDFRPQYVLALSKLEGKRSGKPAWYRISVPGRPERPRGLGARRVARAPSGLQAPHHLTGRPAVRVLGQGQARPRREGRRG